MRKWYPWALIGAVFVFSRAVYHRLPERLPTHWDAGGVPDGWSGRPVGVWLIPGIMIAVALILPLLPNIDPRRDNYEKFRPTYDLVVNSVITLLAIIDVAMIGVGLGWPLSMERFVPLMVGGLFVFLGNLMPRARPNWWFGIRTPWTLSNDRVWDRTHRLGGLPVVSRALLRDARLLLP